MTVETLMIFGRAVPVYGLIGVSGMCLAMAYALFSCRKFGLDRDDTAYIFVFGALGAVAGAKVLYLFLSTGNIIRDILSGEMSFGLAVNKYISGGMVFYGGFIGALALAGYMAVRYEKDIVDFFPVLIPGFALAHGIARIGCLLAGCCYGAEADLPFSITYHSSHIAPNGVPLLPVQAIEAVVETAIFVVLVYAAKRAERKISVLWAYILMYAPARFCLEFFRGDEARGGFLMFSVSQWISIILVAAVLVQIYISGRRNRKTGFQEVSK